MILPARPEDADAIRRLVQGAYGHYVARMGEPLGPMLDDDDERVAAGQASVLEEGGVLAGVLILEDAGDGTMLLDNVAVAPSAQGKGLGRALIAFAEAEAQRRGLREVRLYTNVPMTESLALYGRLGFRETGRVSKRGYERVYMAKAVACP